MNLSSGPPKDKEDLSARLLTSLTKLVSRDPRALMLRRSRLSSYANLLKHLRFLEILCSILAVALALLSLLLVMRSVLD